MRSSSGVGIPLLFALLATGACSGTQESKDLSDQVARAHGGPELYSRPGVAGRLEVVSGGSPVLAGDLFFEPDTGRSRIDLAEGGRLIFDGERAWVVRPSGEPFPRARFHLLTWPYFISAPWKLGDPGVQLSPVDQRPLEGEMLPSARLTFERGVGDTPDDWYVVFADPETNELRALAYIVTYGTTVEEASEDPHVATYEQFVEVEGMRVPSLLRFWNWNENGGIQGPPIGRASFTEVSFREAPEGFFRIPPTAVESTIGGQ